MMKKLTVLLLLTACFAALGDARTIVKSKLIVRVTNVRSTKGKVGVAVFNTAKGFPNIPASFKRVRVDIDGTTATAVIDDLEPGTYAVAATHDENNNDKMETNFLGIPKEGYGFSNDARGRLGAPSFNAAKFNLNDASQTVTIKMGY